jgi:hypothetical protein
MNTSQPIVAIVDGSAYMDQIVGVLIRNGFTLVMAQSTTDGFAPDVSGGVPHAIVYCVRDEDATVDRVQRFYWRLQYDHPLTRVVVCSGDLALVQSMRTAGQDDGPVMLYEPFDAEMLLEAIGSPSRSAEHEVRGRGQSRV